jgi:hypothetical protein
MNDIPLAGIGHNAPPEPIDIDAEIEALIANANAWAEQHPVVETEEVAAKAIDNLNQLQGHRAKYDALRKKEKKPFDDGAAAVQNKWLPKFDRIDACIKVFVRLRASWFARDKEQREAAEREAEREAAEARRRADQLTEQAQARGTATNLIAATNAAQEAERKRQEAAAIPKKTQIRGSLGGRVHSPRTVWFAYIADQDLCYQHFRNHPDMKALLQRLANAAARSGVRNPNLGGCLVDSKEE